MSVLKSVYTVMENAIVRRVRSLEAEMADQATAYGKTPGDRLKKLDELRLNPFVMFV